MRTILVLLSMATAATAAGCGGATNDLADPATAYRSISGFGTVQNFHGDLLGTRMVLNELIAYSRLGPLKETLDPRSFVIATYALCGFANFGSIGIQIGGIGALAPERRHDLARLGFRALLAGTFANFMTACIAGMLL